MLSFMEDLSPGTEELPSEFLSPGVPFLLHGLPSLWIIPLKKYSLYDFDKGFVPMSM
jgi:hypothetical protein